MNSQQIIVLLALAVCAVSVAISAPLEESAGQTSEPSSSPKPDQPAQDDANKTSTGSMPVSSVSDTPSMANISFTCYGRAIGYYADEDLDCKVYHFCLLGEYNGEPVYQRISYICLNGTFFDQQALDCVEHAKQTTPCKESHQHYELSNKLLRQAIVGKRNQEAQPTPVTGNNETSAKSSA